MGMKDVILAAFRLDGKTITVREPYVLNAASQNPDGITHFDSGTSYTSLEINSDTAAGYSELFLSANGVRQWVVGMGGTDSFYIYDVEHSENVFAVGSASGDPLHVFRKFGYGPNSGTGVAVTQETNITTTVVANAPSGTITTVTGPSIAAGAEAEFTVTNSFVAVKDTVILTMQTQFTDGVVIPYVKSLAAGSFVLGLSNVGAAAVSAGTAKINFLVMTGQIA
jgi:hypothetical protein